MIDLPQVWDALPFPALVLGPEDIVLAVNSAAEQLSGGSFKQLAKRGLGAYFGDNSIVLATVLQARAEKSALTQYDVGVVTGDRTSISCNVYVRFLSHEKQQVLVIIQPTGVAQKMSQSITHMNAARSVAGMAGMLAHEIRNPLAGINGAAQLLAMNANEDDVELTEMIQDEAKRIGNLVDRVEHFGDQRPARRDPVNIHDVLDRSIRAAKAGYGQNMTFNVVYDPSLPDAAGEADQLLQVFQNLLKNACEASVTYGSSIRIKTSYNSGVKYAVTGSHTENLPLQIEVSDGGKGIPDNLINDIFDPFVTSKSNGTGLGLSLVSKIVAGHGGLIECTSHSGNTTFCVRLPIWRNKKDQN
jgi:two-component system nitrogen regulation sensor histidine kinase GlnL